MKKTLQVKIERPLLISVTDIAFATVPYCGGGYHQLKMSLLMPRNRKDVKPRPLLI